ncbi:MAG TPA: dephospho-CoA kinase [Gammaproteobacteria bacterium]|jgi:dephospho-CoA kinase
MFRVGLTGGVASGKSTAAKLFAELGAGIVDTDAVAREVVDFGEPGLEAVAAEFGDAILQSSGELDRRALRELVFRQPERRKRLEAILHPLIRARTAQRLAELAAPYAIVVVPLMFETGFDTLVDRTAVVDCPEATQLARLQRRDGLEGSDAQAMLDAQLDRRARLSQADDIIDNSGDIEQLKTRVAALHTRYMELAGD